MRTTKNILVVAALCVVCGCDDEEPIDPGTDAGPMAMDAGDETDAGPGEDDAGEADAGARLPLGAACAEASECESNSCINPASAVEIGTGFCSHSCASDDECGDLPSDDGYTYACVAESTLVSRCHRVCDDGFGCPEDAFCINDFGFASGPADICLDVSNDRCRAESDCTDPERCTLLIDRERAHQVCFAPRAMDLSPLPSRGPGESCDPVAPSYPLPCDTAADCDAGYTCEENAAGLSVCTVPQDERCHLLCLVPGVCTGVCDTDADCPGDMRCSRGQWPYIQNTPGRFDDRLVDIGFCTYATGSGTACDADDDCAASGAGGAAEVCWPTSDETGANNHVCVTPPTGYGLEGEACGDDPTTDGVRESRLCAGGQCIARSCGAVCDTAADCPSGWQCVEALTDGAQTTRHCADAQECTADGDCDAGEVCQGVVTDIGTGYRRVCITPNGALGAGEACDATLPGGFAPFADTCEAFCFDFGEGPTNGLCTEQCVSDADCPGADWICAGLTQTLANGDTFPDRTDDETGTIDVCLYLPGSQADCTLSSDCATGERCLGYVDLAGVAQRVCVTEVAGGGEPGEPCSADDPCAGRSCIPRWDNPGAAFCGTFCAADADCPTDFVCRRNVGDDPDFTEPVCLPADDPRGLPR